MAELVRHLARSQADVKWVEEENFHLTLKFLGEVDPGRLGEVAGALRSAVREVPAFRFQATGTGAFPSPRRARVIWVGVGEGTSQLRHLAARVDAELARLGFPPEERPFTPHLTLGRVRSPRGLDELARLLEGARFPALEVTVDGIVLFQSVLGRAGPLYTALNRFPLQG